MAAIESSALPYWHGDVSGHAHGQSTIAVVDAQPDFKSFDVPLAAADVALRGEAGVGAAKEHRPGAFRAGREPHLELLPDSYPIDISLGDVSAHPKIVRIDQGQDRLGDVHDFTLKRYPRVHESVNG